MKPPSLPPDAGGAATVSGSWNFIHEPYPIAMSRTSPIQAPSEPSFVIAKMNFSNPKITTAKPR